MEQIKETSVEKLPNLKTLSQLETCEAGKFDSQLESEIIDQEKCEILKQLTKLTNQHEKFKLKKHLTAENANRNSKTETKIKLLQYKLSQLDSNDTFDQNLQEFEQESSATTQTVGQHVELNNLNSIFEYITIDGLKIKKDLFFKLYNYQQTCVKWLWKLHKEKAGGIIADEMGLGKSAEIIFFLYCVSLTNCNESLKFQTCRIGVKKLGPVLIITPTTLLQFWKLEFGIWFPESNVGIYHNSCKKNDTWSKFIKNLVENNGVLVTSYGMVLNHSRMLSKYCWHYVVLDEGHVIKNHLSKLACVVKMFDTCHKIILTGTPFQNNLVEFWSLFDFVFPSRLGNLIEFKANFVLPILQGSFKNATIREAQIAKDCAIKLKSIISPYLIRRRKVDVQQCINLPLKDEQILFCTLTDRQKKKYKNYLNSDECLDILRGKMIAFKGISVLRKISNHPDLNIHLLKTDEKYPDQIARMADNWHTSGKFTVTLSLLKCWHEKKHRVLFFTQSRKVLDIMAHIAKTFYLSFRVLNGSTSCLQRGKIVEEFNKDESIFMLLLTTRVGGIGLNLIGADRIIIFDPDWNPCTDMQARERAWRIGQKRDVTIYRLLTVGTVEEKIYQKQIFKRMLAQRIFKNADQCRVIAKSDLRSLFTYYEEKKTSGGVYCRSGESQTSQLFSNVEGNFRKRTSKEEDDNLEGVVVEEKKICLIEKKIENQTTTSTLNFQEDYILDNILHKAGAHSSISHNKVENIYNENDHELTKHKAKIIVSECLEIIKNTHEKNYNYGKNDQTDSNSFNSASILHRIRQKDVISGKKDNGNNVTSKKDLKIVQLLVEFMKKATKNGQIAVASNDILDHFKSIVGGEQVYIFKETLKRCCHLKSRKFQNNNNDKSCKCWYLRKNFINNSLNNKVEASIGSND